MIGRADYSVKIAIASEAHERQFIEQALLGASGKVAAAASRLGIPHNTRNDEVTKFQIVAKAFREA
ncbi:MAG: hypothetical protein AAF280_03885 [Pseudomonadota bacterium]